jgi:long-chain acyl-CoA synthetase
MQATMSPLRHLSRSLETQMLYQAWQQTLARNRDALALHDAATGLRHSFADVQRLLDAQPNLPARSPHVVSVNEGVANFLTQTLRAWRDDAVLCPVEREDATVPDILRLPDSIVHLKLTSGSTGEPRCVMFRPEQLVADAGHIRATMKLDASCPNLAVVSVAHSYGFSNLVLPLLLHGHALVSVPDPLPGSLRAAFQIGLPLTVPAVPAMWRAWWQAVLLKDAPIGLAISAGAPLPLEVERGIWTSCGLKIHNFYGSSECGGIAYDQSDTPREDPSLAGSPMTGVHLSVDEDGCLMVRGPNVAEGYWPHADAALGGGRFVTSDLVEIRGDLVLMRGRVSDAINIAGRKLNPADVEHALLACEGVKHCVVFGVPSADASRCEEAVACVSATAETTEKDLLDVAGARLATWQLPRRVWFCNELCPDTRGKLSRAAWRAKWLRSHERMA